MTSSPPPNRARTPLIDVALLVLFLALPLGIGLTASRFTLPSIPTWYAQLVKPAWTPPNALFGPVWTALYLLMGIAAWRIARAHPASQSTVPLLLWCVQLALNFAWSLLFFHWQRVDWALYDIVALWVVIVITLGAFGRLDWPAGAMLVPYLLWVTYAVALNGAIYGMNP